MGPKMRLRSGLKHLGIELMVSNQIILSINSALNQTHSLETDIVL